jgi:hypothetical protein
LVGLAGRAGLTALNTPRNSDRSHTSPRPNPGSSTRLGADRSPVPRCSTYSEKVKYLITGIYAGGVQNPLKFWQGDPVVSQLDGTSMGLLLISSSEERTAPLME